MGINGLWDILGDGEIISIAELSTEHFQRTGRPLRVAVDEAGWRFNNLTDFQVAMIREKEPAANPIEKQILYRLAKLLRLNIQLLFVFDGPGRPWKRGRRGGGKIDFNQIKLLRELLKYMGVPHHMAPGEAEAECAKLQREGVVDAVWSEDGDTLMFGAGMLLCNHRKDKKKSDTHVQVYRASFILRDHGLNQDGLVLFAILSGGDYDVKGLERCGPKLAHLAAKAGLGAVLCHSFDPGAFRQRLMDFLILNGKSIDVPAGFPKPLILKNYLHPKVSSPEELHNLRGLRSGWNLPVNQTALRVLLRDRFNIWTLNYIKHIAPVILTKNLAHTEADEQVENTYDIKILAKKQTKKQKLLDEQGGIFDKRVLFSPTKLLSFSLHEQPCGEDWSRFKAGGKEYDPTKPTECELLECVLERGCPVSIWCVEDSPPAKTVRKRKSGVEDDDIEAPAKRKRQSYPETTDSIAGYTGRDYNQFIEPSRHFEYLESEDEFIDGPLSASSPKVGNKRDPEIPSASQHAMMPRSNVFVDSSSPSTVSCMDKIEELSDMGFDRELARTALQYVGQDVIEAVDWMLAIETGDKTRTSSANIPADGVPNGNSACAQWSDGLPLHSLGAHSRGDDLKPANRNNINIKPVEVIDLTYV